MDDVKDGNTNEGIVFKFSCTVREIVGTRFEHSVRIGRFCLVAKAILYVKHGVFPHLYI